MAEDITLPDVDLPVGTGDTSRDESPDEFPTPNIAITGTHQSYDEVSGMHSYRLINANSGEEELVQSGYPLEDIVRPNGS